MSPWEASIHVPSQECCELHYKALSALLFKRHSSTFLSHPHIQGVWSIQLHSESSTSGRPKRICIEDLLALD